MAPTWEPGDCFTSPCPGCPDSFPFPVITLCSIHVISPAFAQTEHLESGLMRTQVLVWDPPPPAAAGQSRGSG